MIEASRTFAGHLKQFSRAVDIVDKNTFDQVRDLIIRYVRRELGEGAYFDLLREQRIGHELVLQTFWSSEDKVQQLRIPAQDTPATISFHQSKPLWVISGDQTPLDRSNSHQDQWSELSLTDLPPYSSPTGRSIGTLIVVPLRRRRALGVLCIEARNYIEATDVARKEMQLLGDALAILLELWELNEAQSQLTDEAVGELRDMITNAKFPKLAKPQVFVAHSNGADHQVTDIIRRVLKEYDAQVQITYWNEISEAGNITTQIGERITTSRFGICYFSEPTDKAGDHGIATDRPGGPKYVDNPNVIFEAGMLHALTNAPQSEPSGWIPIRERESSHAPFDFAAERILIVTRTETGDVAERFQTELKRRVSALLGST